MNLNGGIHWLRTPWMTNPLYAIMESMMRLQKRIFRLDGSKFLLLFYFVRKRQTNTTTKDFHG